MSDKKSFKENLAHKAKVGAVVGSAATVFLAGASIAKASKQSTEEIINSSSQATNNYMDSVATTNNNLTATVRRNDGSKIEYPFNPHDILQNLNEAIKIYKPLAERYKYTRLLSPSEKKDFEDAMDTILQSNVKFIEIQTQDIKIQIANALRDTLKIVITPNDIDITYNDTSKKVSMEIDGIPVENIGPEFENLISEYKQYILTTEFNDWKNYDLDGKMRITDEVIKNICDSNKLFESFHNANSEFQMIEDERAGYTITSIEFIVDEEIENIHTSSIQVERKASDGQAERDDGR